MDAIHQHLPNATTLLKSIGLPLALITGLVLGRFALLTRNYKRHNKLKPKVEGATLTLDDVPRLKSTFTIAYWGDPNGSFEDFIDQLLDENGHAMPISHHGPEVFGNVVICFTNPDTFREVFTNTSKFSKQTGLYQVLGSEFLGNGLLTSSGELWHSERKTITHLFHYNALQKAMVPVTRIANEMIEFLQSTNGKPIDSPFVSDWTMKIVIASSFGEGFDDYLWMADTFHKLGDAFGTLMMWSFLLGPKVASWLPLPYNIRRRQLKSQVITKVERLIEQRKEQMKNDDVPADLISILLSSPTPIPTSLIADEALTFLIAGADTVSAITQWALYFIAANPHVQDKLRDEVFQVVGTDEITSDLEVNKLEYMKHVLHETLRLRPPSPGLHRNAEEDCVLEGVAIPKGTDLLMMLLATHLDARHWKNPKEFIPERFEEQGRHPFAYIPFSAGGRNCIGQKFGMQEASVLIAAILQKFRVETTNTSKVLWKMHIGVIHPKDLKLNFVPLKKDQ